MKVLAFIIIINAIEQSQALLGLLQPSVLKMLKSSHQVTMQEQRNAIIDQKNLDTIRALNLAGPHDLSYLPKRKSTLLAVVYDLNLRDSIDSDQKYEMFAAIYLDPPHTVMPRLRQMVVSHAEKKLREGPTRPEDKTTESKNLKEQVNEAVMCGMRKWMKGVLGLEQLEEDETINNETEAHEDKPQVKNEDERQEEDENEAVDLWV